MSYQLSAVSFYLIILIPIVLMVGQQCYKNGELYITAFSNDLEVCYRANNLLRVAYYLTIIGYIIFSISSWQQLNNITQIIHQVSSSIGQMLILIGILHMLNLIFMEYYIQLITNQKS